MTVAVCDQVVQQMGLIRVCVSSNRSEENEKRRDRFAQLCEKVSRVAETRMHLNELSR